MKRREAGSSARRTDGRIRIRRIILLAALAPLAAGIGNLPETPSSGADRDTLVLRRETLEGPAWALAIAGLRDDLASLSAGLVARQTAAGRFAAGDTVAGGGPEMSWSESLRMVEFWPAYIGVTGDQDALRALMGLALAFGDAVLGLAPGDSGEAPARPEAFPESLRAAVATLVSFSYDLVPHGPAEAWLRAAEERWTFRPADPLWIRLQLALLRQTREAGRAARIREMVRAALERPMPEERSGLLAAADVLCDLTLVTDGPEESQARKSLREQAGEMISRALELGARPGAASSMREEGRAAELLLRYLPLADEAGRDRLLARWMERDDQERPCCPMTALVRWLTRGDEGDLEVALARARRALEEASESFRADRAPPGADACLAARQGASVLAFVTQGGFGTHGGRVPETLVRFREANNAPGLRWPVAVHWQARAPEGTILAFWNSSKDPATVWVEPAREGASLGRSWWEVRRTDDAGEARARWSPLPFLKIGRIGPLVLGPRRPLRLKMEWSPGEGLLEEWSRPHRKPVILGPGGPALR